jgi:hypothetical protein
MTVPRRLPPTQGERVRNIDRSHAALSAQGRTASARPVPQGRPENRVQAPTGNVVTGTGAVNAVSITSTAAGQGSSAAAGLQGVAVGPNADASGNYSVSIGTLSAASAQDCVVVGDTAYGYAEQCVALGYNTGATAVSGTAVGAQAGVSNGADYGLAVGFTAASAAAGGVAIGADHNGIGARADNQDDFVLGTDQHHVIIAGALVLSDGSGGLWRITVSGGSLSAVAYP